jgi:limonene-1,2-epoxide hydrolase
LRSVHHLIVTCNPDGALAKVRASDERSLVLLMPPETNDEGFAMTSSFTSMVLATWLVLNAGTQDEAMVERVAAAGTAVLSERADAVAEFASRGYQRIVYLGSGALTGLARESALKVLELSAGNVVSYFDSSLGFRHGPKSVLDGASLAIVYLSTDPYSRQYGEDIAVELAGQMGKENVIVLGSRPSERIDLAWTLPGLEDAPDVLVSLPFVLVAQPSLFDPTRAPPGKHTLWGYCHVPNGSHIDMSVRIERQIERFAPGFRDCIIERRVTRAAELPLGNANLVGGDIGAGANTLRQLLFRPAIRANPYATSVKGLYLCSASTPPGGGVHGMCGMYAAQSALAALGHTK